MEIERYKRIVSAIENLGTTEVQELFRLLHKNGCPYTSNNNGIFINLNWVAEDLLDKIEKYIYFCNRSNQEIRRYESLQDVLNQKLHAARPAGCHVPTPKRVPGVPAPACETGTGSIADAKPKVSSSMRFYLLKKRYAKPAPPPHIAKNDISKEPLCIL